MQPVSTELDDRVPEPQAEGEKESAALLTRIRISDADHCYEYAHTNPDLAVHFCSAAIKSRQLSASDLATTLNNRVMT
jgi:hypothetical protein